MSFPFISLNGRSFFSPVPLLPAQKHLKSPFILLIGFSAFRNAFPWLMKSVLQDPLTAELGTGGATYTAQTEDLGPFLPLRLTLLPASVLCKFFWHV